MPSVKMMLVASTLLATMVEAIVCPADYQGDANYIASIDLDKFTRAVTPIFWSYMMKVMNGGKIGNLNHEHGSLVNNTLYVTGDALQLEVIPPEVDQSLTFKLKASKLGLGLTSQYYSNKVGFVSSSGNLAAQFDDAAIEADIQVTTNAKKDQFAIKVSHVQINLPSDQMDLTIHGDMFSYLAPSFESNFEKYFRQNIEQQIKDKIQILFPKVLNKMIARNQKRTQLDKYSTFDWKLSFLIEELSFNKRVQFGLRGYRHDAFDQLVFDKQDCWDIIDFEKQETGDSPDFLGLTWPPELEDIVFETPSPFLGTLKLLTTKQEPKYSFNALLVTADIVGQHVKWLPQGTHQKLPTLSTKGMFWTEHLNNKDAYTREKITPISHMIHNWLSQYYDNFGILKLLEKMYLPFICWIIGENMP